MSIENTKEAALQQAFFLLDEKLPRDGLKIKKSTEFVEALKELSQAAREGDPDYVDYWRRKAEIRLDDLTGDTHKKIVGLEAEKTPAHQLIAAIAENKTPDVPALKQWLESTQSRSAA